MMGHDENSVKQRGEKQKYGLIKGSILDRNPGTEPASPASREVPGAHIHLLDFLRGDGSVLRVDGSFGHNDNIQPFLSGTVLRKERIKNAQISNPFPISVCAHTHPGTLSQIEYWLLASQRNLDTVS